MMKWQFLLLLVCVSSAYEILSNTPRAGEDLQVLFDGGGNGTAKITSPGGQEYAVQLRNGQGSLRTDAPGNYIVEFEGQKKVVVVSEREFASGAGGAGIDYAQIAVFSAILLCILGAIGFAVWKMWGEKMAREEAAKPRPDAKAGHPEQNRKKKLARI